MTQPYNRQLLRFAVKRKYLFDFLKEAQYRCSVSLRHALDTTHFGTLTK